MARTMRLQLVLLLAVMMVAACSSQLRAVGAQNCGPAANGNKCGDNNCCSKFGYCGQGDSYCGSGCQPNYGKCTGSCFPADAMVLLRGGIQKPISELSIGDQVAVSIGKDGSILYDEVYANGHTDSVALSEFVVITLRNVVSNATKNLQLTADHFVPVLISKGNTQYKRAKDVVVGDTMMAFDEQVGIHFSVVIGLHNEILRGLYNPFTMRGTILVNSVLASCHSDWFLDSTFNRIRLSHLLPSAYQAVLAPIRLIYKQMGSSAYKSLYTNLDSRYNIAKSGSNFHGYIGLLRKVFLPESNKVTGNAHL